MTISRCLRVSDFCFGGGCLSRREKTFRKDIYSNRLHSRNVFSPLKKG